MKSDIFLLNGRVVNVYSGEILPHHVAVSGEKICYVGPSKTLIGSKTEVIDVKGSFILPGFFDAHAHADLFYHPFTYANQVAGRESLERVPVIKIINQTVTAVEEIPLKKQNGFYLPEGDILAATLVSRDGTLRGRGLCEGYVPDCWDWPPRFPTKPMGFW